MATCSEIVVAPGTTELICFFNPVPHRNDGLERLERGRAVILFLRLSELLVRHEAGMLLAVIIALRTVAPTLGDPPPCPILVDVLRQQFAQLENIVGQLDVGRINRFGRVTQRDLSVVRVKDWTQVERPRFAYLSLLTANSLL